MQRLVGEPVGARAESRSRDVVHPVRPRVVRHRGPREERARRERDARGHGGATSPGEPQERREEEDGRLECGADADEQARALLAAGGEAAEQDEKDRDDAGLAEMEGVAHRQRQHQEADRDGGGEQRGAPGDGPGQGTGDDETEDDDEAECAEGPGPAERLFGAPGQRLQHQSPERGTGEPVGVVEGARHVEDTFRTDPGLQVREPLTAGGAQDGHDLPHREHRGDQPEARPDHAQPRCRGPRHQGFARSMLHVRHAPSALPPCVLSQEARTTPGVRRRQPLLHLSVHRYLTG